MLKLSLLNWKEITAHGENAQKCDSALYSQTLFITLES